MDRAFEGELIRIVLPDGPVFVFEVGGYPFVPDRPVFQKVTPNIFLTIGPLFLELSYLLQNLDL